MIALLFTFIYVRDTIQGCW